MDILLVFALVLAAVFFAIRKRKKKKNAGELSERRSLLPRKKYPYYEMNVFSYHDFDDAGKFRDALDGWLSETMSRLLDKDILPDVSFIPVGYTVIVYVRYEL